MGVSGTTRPDIFAYDTLISSQGPKISHRIRSPTPSPRKCAESISGFGYGDADYLKLGAFGPFLYIFKGNMQTRAALGWCVVGGVGVLRCPNRNRSDLKSQYHRAI